MEELGEIHDNESQGSNLEQTNLPESEEKDVENFLPYGEEYEEEDGNLENWDYYNIPEFYPKERIQQIKELPKTERRAAIA
jgi:hypothetical protein